MIVEVTPIWVYITVIIIAAFVVSISLMVKSSGEFSPEEVEEEADTFAGDIRDSHGPITTFLWVSYAGLAIWAIIYFYLHFNEFLSLFY